MINCNNNKGILTQKKMTQVLLELHLAEALAQHIPKDSLQNEIKNTDSLVIFTREIFTKNQVTEKEFLQSLEWYKSKPELLDSMYQNILSEIAILHSKKVK
jgi:hypothetical protein